MFISPFEMVQSRRVSFIASMSTDLVDIYVLSWSMCLYRLTMLRAAILNSRVEGIPKLGWFLIWFWV